MFNPQQKPGDELRTQRIHLYSTTLSTQGWFWSCNKRHFSSVIHRYSEQPNERRHHSSWSGVSGATPVTCVTSSLRDGFQPPGSILNLPCIPKLGSSSIHLRPLFTASAKCISQPSNDGMEWHEVQQVFFESVFLVRVREQERRAKGEWTTDQLWSGIHFEEVGRKAFCDPMCLIMVWAEMCENSSCDPSASEMCKFPFEEALDQKSMRFTQKKAYSVEPKSISWHSKPLQKLFKNVISLKCAQSASF